MTLSYPCQQSSTCSLKHVPIQRGVHSSTKYNNVFIKDCTTCLYQSIMKHKKIMSNRKCLSTQNYVDDKDVQRFHSSNIYTCTRNICNTSVQASLMSTAVFFSPGCGGKQHPPLFLSEPVDASLKNCFEGRLNNLHCFCHTLCL